MGLAILKHKVERSLSDAGWQETATRIAHRLWSPFYEHRVYRIYRIDLASSSLPLPRESAEFTFKSITADDTSEIRQIEEYAEWIRDTLAAKLSSGSVCLVALDRETVAGFNLVSFGCVDIPLLNMHRRFPAGSAWSEHIAVFKDYRRRGLGSQLRYRIFRVLQTRRVRWLYGGARVSNTASLNLAQHVGFQPRVDVHYFQILGRQLRDYRPVRSDDG